MQNPYIYIYIYILCGINIQIQAWAKHYEPVYARTIATHMLPSVQLLKLIVTVGGVH